MRKKERELDRKISRQTVREREKDDEREGEIHRENEKHSFKERESWKSFQVIVVAQTFPYNLKKGVT